MLEQECRHGRRYGTIVPSSPIIRSTMSLANRLLTFIRGRSPQRNRFRRTKPRPPILRALGADDPPAQVEIDKLSYRRGEIFKHDTWAATAVYESSHDRVVCKFNRQQSLFGLPLKWIGHWLASRETHVLQALANLPGIPAFRGPVMVDGKRLRHAVAHVFVEGHPLGIGDPVDDAFFPRLQQMLHEMHVRGVVYVDLHKRENIVVGNDGQPHLIDFQVCFIRPRWWLPARLLRGFEQMLRDMDWYHLRKHISCNRPDLAGCNWHQFNLRNDRPWWIRAHRCVAAPMRAARRGLLVWLGVRQGKGMAESELVPEIAKRGLVEGPRLAA
jgi:hypothetical protein